MVWPWQAASPAPPGSGSYYSFAWRLSGDRAVAPLQVFDDGIQTWLQFSESQAIPAVFARGPEGDRLLSYSRQGPYIVLSGVWPELVLRGGTLASHVRRVAQAESAAQAAELKPGEPGAADSGAALQAATSPVAGPRPASPAPNPDPHPPQAAEMTAASFVDLGLQASASFQAGPQDLTMRAALNRWAKSAGWTFEPEHWVVDVDIPLAGAASFDSEFKSAVRELLASTELGERPLQPCFYSNKVLRIVPFAQPCDRSVGGGRAS
jgi:hypothetical protein